MASSQSSLLNLTIATLLSRGNRCSGVWGFLGLSRLPMVITVGKQKLVILWRSLDWNGRGSRSYSHGYNTVKWSTVIIQWVINFWSSLSRGGHKKPSRWALNPNSRICENYYFLLLTSSSQDIRALDHQRWTLREDFTRYHLVLSILSYSPILSEFDSLIMAAFWDLSFASLPPSPEWAPFWSSLFEGALSAFFIWLIAQNGPTRTSAFELICYSLIHVCRFVFAILSAFQDGWLRLSVTECCGRTIVVSLFMVAVYTSYDEQGQACDSSLLTPYWESAKGW